MSTLNEKSNILSKHYYETLPINIKIILGDPFAPGNIREGATKIIKEAGLNESARIHLHNVIYGLFTMELPNLESLPQVLQEELKTTPEKAREIAFIIKQFFIEPHKTFFERIYSSTNNEQGATYNKSATQAMNKAQEINKGDSSKNLQSNKQNIVNLKTKN